jgi:transposase
MPSAITRDITDEHWENLDDLIPEPKRRADGRGRPWKSRRAVMNGIFGFYAPVLHGRTSPSAIRPTRLATAGFNNGSAPE